MYLKFKARISGTRVGGTASEQSGNMAPSPHQNHLSISLSLSHSLCLSFSLFSRVKGTQFGAFTLSIFLNGVVTLLIFFNMIDDFSIFKTNGSFKQVPIVEALGGNMGLAGMGVIIQGIVGANFGIRVLPNSHLTKSF